MQFNQNYFVWKRLIQTLWLELKRYVCINGSPPPPPHPPLFWASTSPGLGQAIQSELLCTKRVNPNTLIPNKQHMPALMDCPPHPTPKESESIDVCTNIFLKANANGDMSMTKFPNANLIIINIIINSPFSFMNGFTSSSFFSLFFF